MQQDLDWGLTYGGSVYYHVDRGWSWFYNKFDHNQPQVHAHIPADPASVGSALVRGGYDPYNREYAIW
jgi:hypothetical protein